MVFYDNIRQGDNCNYTVITAAVIGVLFILLLLIFRWKRRTAPCELITPKKIHVPSFSLELMDSRPEELIHKLTYNKNELPINKLQEKDSLEEHLNVLTKKLAEKESMLALSKTKVRETHCEVSNLHAIDKDIRMKYQDIINALRTELLGNEMECRKLQRQIQFVSKKRAEITQEVNVAQTR